MGTKRKNILLIMADQHNYKIAGCYGHKTIITPNIDALADSGCVLDTAYCPSPLCAPSRAAMMAGRHVHHIGAWDNASLFRDDIPTFAHSFNAAGYDTVLCGKMHFVGHDQNHGFRERWTQDIYPATFSWTYPSRDKNYSPPRGKGVGQAIHRVHESGVGRTPDMDYDDEVSFRSVTGLRRIARAVSRNPFMLCVSFTGPHYPFYCPQKYANLYPDEAVDMPELPADFQFNDNQIVEWFRDYAHLDTLVPDEVIRRARRATFGRVTMIDEYVGQLLETLKECGLEEDTIVIYTSDHGDMLGEHGLWFKCNYFEGSVHVPFIVRGAGLPARRIAEPFNLIDLGPTLCGLAGIESLPDPTDGRDFAPLLRGERADNPEGESIVTYYAEGSWRGWRVLRKGDYKLVLCPGVEPILYNLRSDPGEWHNIAKEPAEAARVREMSAVLFRDWDPEACDEAHWANQEQRVLVNKGTPWMTRDDWQIPAPGVPHPFTPR